MNLFEATASTTIRRVGTLNILERLRQAAKEGDPYAQFELGYAFDCGFGVEQDIRKAAEFYAKAAEQGHRVAEHNLLLQHVSRQVKLHLPAVVFAKFESRAEAGDRDAQNNLGLCFQHGYGIEQDYGQAMVWFRRAADGGLAVAHSTLEVFILKAMVLKRTWPSQLIGTQEQRNNVMSWH